MILQASTVTVRPPSARVTAQMRSPSNRRVPDGALCDFRMLPPVTASISSGEIFTPRGWQLLERPDELVVAAARVDLEQVAGAEPPSQ